MPTLTVIDLGRAPYGPTLALQQRLLDDVLAHEDGRAYLVLVEHDPPVITLGRGAEATNVLADPDRLAARGIQLVRTSRGGDVTWHGPGQLVGYPILRLPPATRPVRHYVEQLEEVLIRMLAGFDIEAARAEGMTGVWAGDAKVAAIGIAVSHWAAWHGFALNVSPDLSAFDLIVPCGLEGRGVTSMSRLLGRDTGVAEVKPAVIRQMQAVFGFDEAVSAAAPPAHQ